MKNLLVCKKQDKMKKQSKKAKAEGNASIQGDGESNCPPRKQARLSKKRKHSELESQSQERTDESMTSKKLVPTFGKKKAVSKTLENTHSSVQLDEEIKVAELSREKGVDSSNSNSCNKSKDREKLDTSTEDINKPTNNPAKQTEADIGVLEKKEVSGSTNQTDIREERPGIQPGGQDEIKNDGSGSKVGQQEESNGCDTIEPEKQKSDMEELPQISEETHKIDRDEELQEINKLDVVSEQKTNSSESKRSSNVGLHRGNDTQKNGSREDQGKPSKTMGIIQEEVSEKPTNDCGTDGLNLPYQDIDSTMEVDMDFNLKKSIVSKVEKESDADKSMALFEIDIAMDLNLNLDQNEITVKEESVSIKSRPSVQIAEPKDDESSKINTIENTMAQSDMENESVLTSAEDDQLLKETCGEINDESESDVLKSTDMCKQHESNVEMERPLMTEDKGDTERSKIGLETDPIESAQTESKQNEEAEAGEVQDKFIGDKFDANDLCSSSTTKTSVEHREEETAREKVLQEIDIAVPSKEKTVSDGGLGELDSVQTKSEAQSEDVLTDDDLMDFTFSQMCKMEEQCLAADAKNRSASMVAKSTPIQTPTTSSSLNLVEPATVPQIHSPWNIQPDHHKEVPLSLPMMSFPLGPSCNLRPGDLKAASIVQGVITELKELNRMILNAKKQIDAVKRQRQQHKQQHCSPRKQQLRQQKLPMSRPTYQPQQRPQQFTPSGTSGKGKEK